MRFTCFIVFFLLVLFSCNHNNTGVQIDDSGSVDSNAVGIDIGMFAPEIELPSPEGNMVSLKSLRGKYVLIDFWASWCPPCRHENKHNVTIYNKFKGKDFEIFAVSLDKTKERWIKAIEQDGLTWINVSDLKYWDSPTATIYGVNGIPYSLLLNKDGRIIEENLSARELEKKLSELIINN